MLDIVAGVSLKNLKPKVWDATSPYYLPSLKAIMVSYADFHKMRRRRLLAMEQGLHAYLGVPKGVKIYLDNGSFYFLDREGEAPTAEYEEFVKRANPDWWPVPRDFIPTPKMGRPQQRACFDRTMQFNIDYHLGEYVPVVHISGFLSDYTTAIKAHEKLAVKPSVALGGIVPNLLRTKKSMSLGKVLGHLKYARDEFKAKRIHVFGVGGTATVHIATLLRMNSIDSSGWRNRAARGIVQLLGSGDRMVANLGKWRGRTPRRNEWKKLRACECPACAKFGLAGLKADGIDGFSNRACHNLWVLLEEAKWVRESLAQESYVSTYKKRLDNSIYSPVIESIVELAGKKTASIVT